MFIHVSKAPAEVLGPDYDGVAVLIVTAVPPDDSMIVLEDPAWQ